MARCRRAGRAGEETNALVIHISQSDQDRRDFGHYLSSRQSVEPVQSALFNKLNDYLSQRLTEEALKAAIDPEILALLVEEHPQTDEQVHIENILDTSLVTVQAQRQKVNIGILKTVFDTVAFDIGSLKVSKEMLAIFSCTGLSSVSCLEILEHVKQNRALILSEIINAKVGQNEFIFEFFLTIITRIREMEPKSSFAGSQIQLLLKWINGTEMPQLVKEFGGDVASNTEFGRYIDEFFGYLLPWGISAYTRIAITELEVSSSQISDHAKAFPAMVKYGVPIPAASWAISLGISSRRVATQLAQYFIRTVEDKSYMGFIRWLSTLSTEYLHYEFHLEGVTLEDVSRVILRVGSNTLIRDYEDLQRFLPREVEIQGIRYEQRSQTAQLLKETDRIRLKRDYDNVIDRNAISVESEYGTLGYLPRDVAQVLAPEIDTGTKVRSKITRITPRLG